MNELERMQFIERIVAMWRAGRIPTHRALAVIADTAKEIDEKTT